MNRDLVKWSTPRKWFRMIDPIANYLIWHPCPQLVQSSIYRDFHQILTTTQKKPNNSACRKKSFWKAFKWTRFISRKALHLVFKELTNLNRQLVSFNNRRKSIKKILRRSLLKKKSCKRKYPLLRKQLPARNNWFLPLKKILSLWINLWRKEIRSMKNLSTLKFKNWSWNLKRTEWLSLPFLPENFPEFEYISYFLMRCGIKLRWHSKYYYH